MSEKISSILERLEQKRVEAPVDEPEPEAVELTAAERFRHALEVSATPPKYLGVPHDLKLHRAAANWLGKPWAVTFLGGVGCGKTWQAARLLGRLRLELGLERTLFADAAEAVERIRQEIATERDGVFLHRMMNAPLLLLDDLGAERGSEFTKDKLGLVLRHRYNYELPTIVTSNYSGLLVLGEKFDDRIASRLSAGLPIVLGSSDRRGAVAGGRP